MVSKGRPVSTADVRPIEDVIEDLRDLLVKGLPRKTLASWGTLGECESIIAEADWFFRDREEGDQQPSELSTWIAHGKKYAAMRIIRKLADNHGVPNIK